MDVGRIPPIDKTPYNTQSSSIGKRPGAAEGSPSFSMEQALRERSAAQDGVIYEHEKSTEAEKKESTADSKGSNASYTSSVSPAPAEDTSQALFHAMTGTIDTGRILEKIKVFFNNLSHNIKRILGNIWESKPLMEQDSKPLSATEERFKTDPANTRELEIWEIPDPWEKEEAASDEFTESIAPMTDADETTLGKPKPAHNTSILTHYDARGRIVQPDPSNTYRILHGDRGSRKT